jgi:hypothetical protein
MTDGYTIAIIRASDGRMAIWHEEHDTAKWDRDTAQFCWQEGNFQCDCNRHTFFEEADGNGDDADHLVCSHGLYIVPDQARGRHDERDQVWRPPGAIEKGRELPRPSAFPGAASLSREPG